MRICWATDLHFDHTDEWDRDRFFEEVRDQGPDLLVLTGDTARSTNLVEVLKLIRDRVGVPVWFVLGNHDVWGSSFQDLHDQLDDLDDPHDLLWMPNRPFVELVPGAAAVGQDGWYDGREGRPDDQVLMNDWVLIEDFRIALGLDPRIPVVPTMADFYRASNRLPPLDACRRHADLQAELLRGRIRAASAHHYHQILVLTHVPPWRDLSRYRGAVANDRHAPWYCWRAGGDVLVEEAVRFRDQGVERDLTVLCGHTHTYAELALDPRIRAHCGSARYGRPALAGVLVADATGIRMDWQSRLEGR